MLNQNKSSFGHEEATTAESAARVGLPPLIANGDLRGALSFGSCISTLSMPVVARLATYFGATLWGPTHHHTKTSLSALDLVYPATGACPPTGARSWMEVGNDPVSAKS